MSENAIELRKVNKSFQDFSLEDVSFSVPKGYITGLIGENGAGKTTLLNIIMQALTADSGEVIINDKPLHYRDISLLEDIYIIFDEAYLNEVLCPKDYNTILENIYKNWDGDKYLDLLKQFNIPQNKEIKDFSKGMKVKLNFAIAFAAGTSILLLDEATSGLDPLIRDDILDLLLDYVQDENHTVLFSSHIITDLEKIADQIVFLHQGKVILKEWKDSLYIEYGVLQLDKKEFAELAPKDFIAYRSFDYGVKVLIHNLSDFTTKYPDYDVETPTVEDIFIFLGKGVTR